ncbi:DNA replication/repair protein RecF [Lysobacteraceae bacterium NML120232]|nr:DNA replication/repair protein RecF [Xanthomonadaceae bacterium NML08-0793]PJK12378.1 DNA replication/repair protein RecF [Xanthomonadaceae bacterium NML120232]
MRIIRLDLACIRSIQEARLQPSTGLNFLAGDNGAGKSSVLEALHLLGFGRSFRGRVRDGLIREEAEAVQIFCEWQDSSEQLHKAGLRHTGADWQAKLNGKDVAQLGDLCAAFAVSIFEPNSHVLVSGGGEPRRRFLDWGLFHVEQGYLALWRRYTRALKQRNALLKQRQSGVQLDSWDFELVEAAEPLHRHRRNYLDSLLPHLQTVSEQLLPTFGDISFEISPGWKSEQMTLADALLLNRARDLSLGYTGNGPHRADWKLYFSRKSKVEAYSRGQAKLLALTCLLAQARHFREIRGEWPLMLLDDFASELDGKHRARVLDELESAGAQVFMTGVELPPEMQGRNVRVFHVEQGRIIQVQA